MYSSGALTTVTLLCNHHYHPSAEVFPPCKTETLYPSNTDSQFPLSPAPGDHHSTFCLCEFVCSGDVIYSSQLLSSTPTSSAVCPQLDLPPSHTHALPPPVHRNPYQRMASASTQFLKPELVLNLFSTYPSSI